MSLWRTVRREAGFEDVRLHDLRHNYASRAVALSVDQLAQLGVPP